jgi:hypothetical protein
MEMDTLRKESDLRALKDAAGGVDDLFQKTVEKAIKTEGHRYNNVQASGETKMMVGNFVAAGSIPSGPGDTYDRITASGKSIVQLGDNYGGRSILTIEVDRCREEALRLSIEQGNLI